MIADPTPADGPEEKAAEEPDDYATQAHRLVVSLATDMAWLMGAVAQDGITIPDGIKDNFDQAVAFLRESL